MNYKKLLPLIPISVFLLFFIPAISADSTEIPAWVKGVANFWAEGNISDSEFGEAITFLIEQEIIKVEMQARDNPELQSKINQLESENIKLQNEISILKSENSKLKRQISSLQQTESDTDPSKSDTSSQSGFSSLVCKRDYLGFAQMTGKYTNGDTPYSVISITLAIIGESGDVLDTGAGLLFNIAAHETKAFTVDSLYSGDFKRCEVQIDIRMK